MEWYHKSAEDAIRELNTDVRQGLEEAAVEHRLERYGENTLPQRNRERTTHIILEQCADVLVVGSLLAMLCALFTRQYAAAVLFLITAAARVVPGTLQDVKAVRSAENLESFTPVQARVLRGGNVGMVPTEELVPGDIVVLEAGDIIPADLRLIETQGVQIDEAIITGQSKAAYKDAAATFTGTAALSERTNMAFAGSAVIYGRGRGVVVATGEDTEIGRVADVLHETKLSDQSVNLRGMGQGIGIFCIAGWVILMLLSLARHDTTVLSGQLVTFSAAIIPAGLAAVSGASLMLTLHRLSQHGIRMNRMTAVEALGRVNVICTDKTGTLTANEMKATLLWSGKQFTVIEGDGYSPNGRFLDAESQPIDPLTRKDLLKTLTAAALCNNAAIEEDGVDTWKSVGDPLEAALAASAEKAGMQREALESAFPRIAEIPFDPERRCMTTLHRTARYPVAYMKGAVEAVLSRCKSVDFGEGSVPLTRRLRAYIIKVSEAMSDKSLRVLALASRSFSEVPAVTDPEELEKDMTFIGLVGLLDPVRADSKDAVRVASGAGIRTVMITGEARATAVAVAKNVGILPENGEANAVLSGSDIDGMNDPALGEVVERTQVFANITSRQKLRILAALQRRGAVVAMIGAGVADVTALHNADVGVAKGQSGTEMTQNAADMVLEQDAYADLVSAVCKCRVLYANLRGAARYLLTAAATAGLLALFAFFRQHDAPFTGSGILLCNLLLFALPGFFIGQQRAERRTLYGVSRRHGVSPLDWSALLEIAVRTVVQTIVCGILYAITVRSQAAQAAAHPVAYASVAVYTLFIMMTLLSAFSCRWNRMPMWEVGDNRDFLALMITVGFGILLHIVLIRINGLTAITSAAFLLCVLFAVLTTLFNEFFKLIGMGMLEKRFPALLNTPHLSARSLDKFSQMLDNLKDSTGAESAEESESADEKKFKIHRYQPRPTADEEPDFDDEEDVIRASAAADDEDDVPAREGYIADDESNTDDEDDADNAIDTSARTADSVQNDRRTVRDDEADAGNGTDGAKARLPFAVKRSPDNWEK